MEFRWRAGDGPLKVVFGPSFPSSTKTRYRNRTPSDKTFGPAHDISLTVTLFPDYLRLQKRKAKSVLYIFIILSVTDNCPT